MVKYGIKVSEPGHDVKTADDINLSLKTDLTMLKVVASGSVNLNGDQEITHNLGYVPQFLVFIHRTVIDQTVLATGSISHTGYSADGGVARADANKLYILDLGDSAKYYIFYEQA